MMKRLIYVLLALLCLLPLLSACDKEPQETPGTGESEPSLIILPDNVNFISMYPISPTEVGYAVIDKSNYGVLLQLTDELTKTSILPLPANSTKTFDNENCLEVNVYGEDGTLMQIAVDRDDIFWIGGGYYTVESGVLSYEHLRNYYSAFKLEE